MGLLKKTDAESQEKDTKKGKTIEDELVFLYGWLQGNTEVRNENYHCPQLSFPSARYDI